MQFINSTFDGIDLNGNRLPGNCIEALSTQNISILGCTIKNYMQDGIFFQNCNGSGLCASINQNEIFNTNNGIHVYNSSATIGGNNLHNNYCGVSLNNNSLSYLSGRCQSTTVQGTQQIANNTFRQIFSLVNFPNYALYNYFYGNTTPWIELVNPSGSTIYDLSNNYWGAGVNTTSQALSKVSPQGRFTISSIWTPGVSTCPPGGGSIDGFVELYEDGLTALDAKNYTEAKDSFQSLLQNYPTCYLSPSALSQLFYIESQLGNDYSQLKSYYLTDSLVRNDSILAQTADRLANKCNIELKNYAEAILFFENIIEHPTSYSDSLFAIIDLGYTYIISEMDSLKACPVGRLAEYKKDTPKQYFTYRNYLLSLVEEKNALLTSVNSTVGCLRRISPNPVKDIALIEFNLDHEGMISFMITNSLGQKVHSVNTSSYPLGYGNWLMSMPELIKGYYILTILINGKPSGAMSFIR